MFLGSVFNILQNLERLQKIENVRFTRNTVNDFALERKTNPAKGIWGPVKRVFVLLEGSISAHRKSAQSLRCSMACLIGSASEFLS